MKCTVLGVVCLLGVGCSASSNEDSESVSVADVKDTLGLGATGPKVRAVHSFLQRAGYFESKELRRDFPRWFPVVAATPNPDSYDTTMESAVRAFQRLNGLAQTGVADSSTLSLMASPRCGTPDVDQAALDERQKYNLKPYSWPTTKTNITYGFTTAFTAAQKTAVVNALNTWSAVTYLTFSENTANPGSADIKFKFGQVQCLSTDAVACTVTSSLVPLQEIYSATTTFNSSYTFTTTTPAPAGQYDLQHTTIHEVGHALGLDHSSLTTSVVYAFYNGQRALKTDDAMAISLKYSKWQTLPGTAIELAAGPDGAVYRLGEAALPGGRQILRWNEGIQNWQPLFADIGATHIALNYYEDLWFTKSDGTLWEWGDDGVEQRPTPPSGLLNIAFGNGSLWALTGTSTAGCGKKTYRLSAGTWSNMGGCGTQIAVQADGKPWVVDQNGNIKRYDGAGSAASDWIAMPGTANFIAASAVINDVGTGVWKTDFTTEEGNAPIRAWNEQLSQWETPRFGNSGGFLAVAPKGQPWLVDVWSYTIQRQRRD